MTLQFEASDRFYRAAADWADRQLMETSEALEVKTEQALLEIEHLVSDAHEVEFSVDGREITHHPTAELADFLAKQAAATGLDEETILELHVDLFARAFLEDDMERPPNAPPPEE